MAHERQVRVNDQSVRWMRAEAPKQQLGSLQGPGVLRARPYLDDDAGAALRLLLGRGIAPFRRGIQRKLQREPFFLLSLAALPGVQ